MLAADLNCRHSVGCANMGVTSSNPKAFDVLKQRIKEIEGKQLKVGWFSSAVYENGTPVAAVAQIQEFGSPARSIPPRPFMRPTIFKNENEWKQNIASGAKKVVAGDMSPQDLLGLLGMKVQGQIQETIEEVTAPPLSPITLGARKYRHEGKPVTGATIGEIARKLKDGSLDISGVPTKPLVDTGYLIATISNIVEDSK